jgi:acyl-coenzyme A synthetase/AMP-(fatty) acid ligase
VSGAAASLPLLGAGVPLDAPLCWRAGRAVSRRQYLHHVQQLAAVLRPHGPLLALTSDRYRFAVAFAAAILRGQAGLLPPNHTADMVGWLRELFPHAYALTEPRSDAIALPSLAFPDDAHAPADIDLPAIEVPRVAAGAEVAHVLTSGSTGRPVPHPKHWGLLVNGALGGAERIAAQLGLPDLHGVTFVGTVPAHHMYGFESTVLLPMAGGAAFAAERPFFPGDIAHVLASVPRPRVLVTTPVHLKALVDADIRLPITDLTISATAPLSAQTAARAEAALGGPLLEIYGCTEAGQVASRRTSQSDTWHTFGTLAIAGNGDAATVSGGHVGMPTPLADVLDVLSPTTFRLLGRSNDMINIAGKRTSLAHLNHQLTSLEGVRDGAFWVPPGRGAEDVVRLVALVVAPGMDRRTLLRALRDRIDAAFLPRPILMVDGLPRDPTGKLPQAALAGLAGRLLAAGASRG